MKYLMLSTYPSESSRNSGDDLLGKSLISLLKTVKGKDVQVDTVYVSNTNVIHGSITDYKAILAPALRPTAMGNSVAPRFRNDFLTIAHQHHIPFYAIGSGWGQYPGTASQSKRLTLDPDEKRNFKKLFNQASDTNKITCRDIYTENVLKNNGISTVGTTGDLALFDPDLLGSSIKRPHQIKTIAVSLPHNRHHYPKAFEIAMNLKKRYACDVKLVLHGKQKVPQNWLEDQIEMIDLSGGAEKLNYYHDIDLHVGFRLHAHIWFLRTRKPSLLVAEDGRGTGHLATVDGLGYSAAPDEVIRLTEWLPDKMHKSIKDFSIIPPSDKVYKLLDNEIDSGFVRTKHSLKKIDHLWEEKMQPFLDLIPD